MLRTALLLILACVLLPACSSPTYINVPAADGDVAFNNANGTTTRRIEQKSLAFVLNERPIAGDVAIRFPAGTTELTAITVIAELPDNVILEGDSATGEYTLIEVRAVRVRGGTAEVDIVRPGTTRERELVTVTLKWRALDGWVATRSRVWGFGVEEADRNMLVPPASAPREPVYQPVQPAPDASDDAGDEIEALPEPVEPQPLEIEPVE